MPRPRRARRPAGPHPPDRHDVLDALDEDDWARSGVYNYPVTAVRDVDWIARHTLHELVHHLMDVDRGLGARR